MPNLRCVSLGRGHVLGDVQGPLQNTQWAPFRSTSICVAFGLLGLGRETQVPVSQPGRPREFDTGFPLRDTHTHMRVLRHNEPLAPFVDPFVASPSPRFFFFFFNLQCCFLFSGRNTQGKFLFGSPSPRFACLGHLIIYPRNKLVKRCPEFFPFVVAFSRAVSNQPNPGYL